MNLSRFLEIMLSSCYILVTPSAHAVGSVCPDASYASGQGQSLLPVLFWWLQSVTVNQSGECPELSRQVVSCKGRERRNPAVGPLEFWLPSKGLFSFLFFLL